MQKDEVFKGLDFEMDYAKSIMDEVWRHMREYKLKALETNRQVEFQIYVGNIEYAKLADSAHRGGYRTALVFPSCASKHQLEMFGWPVFHSRESKSVLTIKGRIK